MTFGVTPGVTRRFYAAGGRRGTVGPAAVVVVALTVALTACGGLRPAPRPTPAAAATLAPTASPAPTAGPTPVALPASGATVVAPAASGAATAAPPGSGALNTPQARPTFDPSNANAADVENAFLSNIDDLIAEAADLTVTPCADLAVVTRDNPTLLQSVRGFAAAVKRLGATEAVLNTQAVKVALSDLDHSMIELEGALSVCGIKQP